MPTEQDLLSGIEEHPEDIDRRLVYADWLDDHGDPRAGHVRARVALLMGEEIEDEPDFDPVWLRFLETQDRLWRVSQRFRGPLPLALRVLWREAALTSAPDAEHWCRLWVPHSGPHGEVTLETTDECAADREEYLENEEVADAFARMFAEIDFVGCDATGAVFGFWHCGRDVAPVVYVTSGADFVLTAATLQDHFALPDVTLQEEDAERFAAWWAEGGAARFEQARAWWAGRGVTTAASPDEVLESLRRFPSPQGRFEAHCRG
jgi:uncharacterized protein (TIGR02996 family)